MPQYGTGYVNPGMIGSLLQGVQAGQGIQDSRQQRALRRKLAEDELRTSNQQRMIEAIQNGITPYNPYEPSPLPEGEAASAGGDPGFFGKIGQALGGLGRKVGGAFNASQPQDPSMPTYERVRRPDNLEAVHMQDEGATQRQAMQDAAAMERLRLEEKGRLEREAMGNRSAEDIADKYSRSNSVNRGLSEKNARVRALVAQLNSVDRYLASIMASGNFDPKIRAQKEMERELIRQQLADENGLPFESFQSAPMPGSNMPGQLPTGPGAPGSVPLPPTVQQQIDSITRGDSLGVRAMDELMRRSPGLKKRLGLEPK